MNKTPSEKNAENDATESLDKRTLYPRAFIGGGSKGAAGRRRLSQFVNGNHKNVNVNDKGNQVKRL